MNNPIVIVSIVAGVVASVLVGIRITAYYIETHVSGVAKDAWATSALRKNVVKIWGTRNLAHTDIMVADLFLTVLLTAMAAFGVAIIGITINILSWPQLRGVLCVIAGVGVIIGGSIGAGKLMVGYFNPKSL